MYTRALTILDIHVQLGSVGGPTLVTYASEIGIPGLYLCGAACMVMMVYLVYTYVER